LAVLSVLGMALIINIAVPPNDKVLYITLALLVLIAIIWYLFENKRFQGPPIGEMIKKRQAEILAAEKAVGEI
jgi:F0F1-type ATP synthase membrane subunit b/b'